MKTIIKITAVLSLFLVSCSSLQTTSSIDDLYYSPKDNIKSGNDIAYNQKYNKADSYSENEEIDNKISSILNDESQENLDTTIYDNDKTGNPYQDIVVDDYDEAYQKRLEAKQSGTYGITNNYFITTTDDYWVASAYLNDPFYNVIIIGDRVWVEPRWITSSFGYYNYYSPWYSRYYGYYGYNDYYGYYGYYNSPYYNYGYPYYNHYHPYYYPHYIINDNNNNWVSSSFSSSRRRSLTTSNPAGIGRSQRASRQLPETYMGNDISRTRTLKDGLDQQGGTTSRRSDVIRDRNTDLSNERTTRVANSVASDRTNSGAETVRRRTTTEGNSANQAVTRTSRQGSSSNPAATGTSRQGSSTYNTSNRTNNTRYVRPAKTSGEGTGNVSRTSGSTSKSGSGGSSYSPTRSSGNSGSTVKSTPTRSSSGSSGNSGSSRSSGNSGSSKSSGSSGSSNSNRGGRR